MSKHTSIDLKQTSNRVAPQSGFVRLVMGNDGNLYYHYDDSNLILATTPWNLPVENYTTTDPTTLTPVLWDRYVIAASAIGIWFGLDNQIAQWNGSGWNYFIPEEGWCIYNKDNDTLLGFNDTTWESVGLSPDNITISSDVSGLTTINEIDYIIDSDEESIDGSDTPMSNPNRELVTRDYIDNQNVNAGNGLYKDVDVIKLGGSLEETTTIRWQNLASNSDLIFILNNDNIIPASANPEIRFTTMAGGAGGNDNGSTIEIEHTGITSHTWSTLNNTTQEVEFDNTLSWNLRRSSVSAIQYNIEADITTGIFITDDVRNKGVEYAADYSLNFTDHSLITKKYVDDTTSLSEYTITLNGTDITNGYIDVGATVNNIFDFKIQGAGEQIETYDFQIGVPDTRVSWSGLGLDGQLRAGHIVSVLYK